MSKRARSESPVPAALPAPSSQQIRAVSFAVKSASLPRDVIQNLSDLLSLLAPEEHQSKRVCKTRPATSYKSTRQAALDVGIDYDIDKRGYCFDLRDGHIDHNLALGNIIGPVISLVRDTIYFKERNEEAFSRLVVDLIVLDRLLHLKDDDSEERPYVLSECPLRVEARPHDDHDVEVTGRADWIIAYGSDPLYVGSSLLVVEAKRGESASSAIPQLVVYLAAIYSQRRGKANRHVFGMASDSRTFIFVALNSEKKLHVSTKFEWVVHSGIILSYIDMILKDALESSPRTTPVKQGNETILNYDTYLRQRWRFGEDDSVPTNTPRLPVDFNRLTDARGESIASLRMSPGTISSPTDRENLLAATVQIMRSSSDPPGEREALADRPESSDPPEEGEALPHRSGSSLRESSPRTQLQVQHQPQSSPPLPSDVAMPPSAPGSAQARSSPFRPAGSVMPPPRSTLVQPQASQQQASSPRPSGPGSGTGSGTGSMRGSASKSSKGN